MGCEDYAAQFDWGATFEQHKGRTKVDTDSAQFGGERVDHLSEETRDHLVAKTIGGTSRSGTAKVYAPDVGDKHPAVPDHNGYCHQTLANGDRCDLDQNNDIHHIDGHFRVAPYPSANVMRADNIAGIGRELPNVLQPDSRPNMYPPHPYQGQPGLIGGSCRVCGLTAPDPVHHAKTTAVPKSQVLNAIQQPVCYVEVTGDRSANYEFLNLATEQSVEIIRELLPAMLNRFLLKNKDYGDTFLNLGPKAEFVRMANKFGKLKQAIWDDAELEFEQVDEILDDLLGHILLARLGLRPLA